MGIKVDPDFVRIYRHEMAIPQYMTGHGGRLEVIDSALQRHEGLFITGNAYRGIGVNDCIENSRRLSDAVSEIFS
jgi:oxygen-dependent protoporphyrinogen oxidase